MRRWCRDSGSATLEVLILVPILFVLANLALYAGQMRMAHSLVRESAQEAARQASISRTFGRSFAYGPLMATTVLGSDQDIRCNPGTWVWKDSLGNVWSPSNTGRPEAVTMTVTCVIGIRMVSAPGIAKYVTITESATSVVDPYRYRS